MDRILIPLKVISEAKVLARKSHDLWVRDSLAPWLHGVARRIASDARKSATRRQIFERRIASIGKSVAVIEKPDDVDELTAVIQEEIHRLPEAHRSEVILCDLQGQTHQEAALVLGCPVGTVKSRQSRAREQLRRRLTRRGIAISSLILESLLDKKRTTTAVAPCAVRNQFDEQSGLPFLDVLSAAEVESACRARNHRWRNRIYTPWITLGMFLSQIPTRANSPVNWDCCVRSVVSSSPVISLWPIDSSAITGSSPIRSGAASTSFSGCTRLARPTSAGDVGWDRATTS
jgi:RNA polymerase sigma factor (sigma-70 family)